MQTMDDLLQLNVYILPKTTITIIYTILHCEGMHTICLICPIWPINQVRLYKPKVLCYAT